MDVAEPVRTEWLRAFGELSGIIVRVTARAYSRPDPYVLYGESIRTGSLMWRAAS